jgi:hypothetical protein
MERLPLIVLDDRTSMEKYYYFLAGNAERFYVQYGNDEKYVRHQIPCIFTDNGVKYIRDILDDFKSSTKLIKHLFFAQTLIIPLSDTKILSFSPSTKHEKDISLNSIFNERDYTSQYALLKTIDDGTVLSYDMIERAEAHSLDADLVITMGKQEIYFEYNGNHDVVACGTKIMNIFFADVSKRFFHFTPQYITNNIINRHKCQYYK